MRLKIIKQRHPRLTVAAENTRCSISGNRTRHASLTHLYQLLYALSRLSFSCTYVYIRLPPGKTLGLDVCTADAALFSFLYYFSGAAYHRSHSCSVMVRITRSLQTRELAPFLVLISRVSDARKIIERDRTVYSDAADRVAHSFRKCILRDRLIRGTPVRVS